MEKPLAVMKLQRRDIRMERLHVFIEASLKEVGIAYKDLVAIAVSHGPGSYTGLRIGVSAAKGLCYALGFL
jgi:tRNA threonylcarbamoyladenosine biosynthesis protein TsaB